jgi:hypothetical protein
MGVPSFYGSLGLKFIALTMARTPGSRVDRQWTAGR